MPHPTDLEKQARETRDLSARARRLARGSPQEARINRFADGLDQRAAELEAEAEAVRPITPRAPVVTHQQQQMQQQQAPEPAAPDAPASSDPKTQA